MRSFLSAMTYGSYARLGWTCPWRVHPGGLIGFVYIWAFLRFARGQVTRLWVGGFALLPSSSGDYFLLRPYQGWLSERSVSGSHIAGLP